MRKTIAVTLVFLVTSVATHAQLNFRFRYYQVFKVSGGFDSTRLWNGGDLKKTFDIRGSIIYYSAKKTVKIKLRDDEYEEVHNVFHTNSKDYYLLINGMRIFSFNDPELGPSVAIYQYPKNVWVIYRQNPQKPKTAVAFAK
ncbi:MAG: hypothetical protein IM613_11030 [Cytophagales bacterium]|nr:hypothetical protein [Cytophagales bacterium]